MTAYTQVLWGLDPATTPNTIKAYVNGSWQALQLFLDLPAINVSDYGAVGDGVTNDTDAIQSAVTALRAQGGGSLVFEPNKTYLVYPTGASTGDKLIDLSDLTGVVVEGNGSKIITGFSDAVFYCFYMENTYDVIIRNFSGEMRGLPVTSGTLSGSYVTLRFAAQNAVFDTDNIPVKLTIEGVDPSDWDGFISANVVSASKATLGGKFYVTLTLDSNPFNQGDIIFIEGLNVAGSNEWNGSHVIVAVSGNTIKYQIASNSGTYASGGTVALYRKADGSEPVDGRYVQFVPSVTAGSGAANAVTLTLDYNPYQIGDVINLNSSNNAWNGTHTLTGSSGNDIIFALTGASGTGNSGSVTSTSSITYINSSATGVYVDGGYVNVLSRFDGPTWFQIVRLCSRIAFENIDLKYASNGLRAKTDLPNVIATNISVNNYQTYSIYYPLTFEFSGHNFFARNVRTLRSGRSYFPKNISNHDVSIYTEHAGTFDDITTACYVRNGWPNTFKDFKVVYETNGRSLNSGDSSNYTSAICSLQILIEGNNVVSGVGGINSEISGATLTLVYFTTDGFLFDVGQSVKVSGIVSTGGVSTSDWNGTYTVTAVGTTAFPAYNTVSFNKGSATGTYVSGGALIGASEHGEVTNFDIQYNVNQNSAELWSNAFYARKYLNGAQGVANSGHIINNLKLSGNIFSATNFKTTTLNFFTYGNWSGDYVSNVSVNNLKINNAVPVNLSATNVTQPGGAGTTVFVFVSNTSSGNLIFPSFSVAEISGIVASGASDDLNGSHNLGACSSTYVSFPFSGTIGTYSSGGSVQRPDIFIDCKPITNSFNIAGVQGGGPLSLIDYANKEINFERMQFSNRKALSRLPQAYTPTWKDSLNADLSPGTGGLLAANYTVQGQICVVNIRISIGTGPTLGTGEWRIGYPPGFSPLIFPNSSIGLYSIGSVFANDSTAGTGNYIGACFALSSYIIVYFGGSVNTTLSATSPFTWGSSDYLDITLTYPFK